MKEFIQTLQNQEVAVTELAKKGAELRKLWEHHFASLISDTEKASIYLEQYLWHVFSYKKLACLENEQAVAAFHSQPKDACYVFYQREKRALKLECADKIKVDHFKNESDIYIVDQEFQWTFVYTHEEYCGPYFYKK